MTKTATRALVTGGSGGIGAAICRRLSAAGHFVYVHAHRNIAAAESIVSAIAAGGGGAAAIHFDLTDALSTRTSVEKLLEDGPVQVLVNNAGVHDDAVFPGMSPAQWHRVIDLSVNGFYNVTQPLMLPMIRTRWGRVINISSVTALAGNRGQVNYAAAKGALNAATRADHLDPHGRRRLRCRRDRRHRADEARRNRARSGKLGGVSRLRGSRLYHRPSDIHQRRDDLI
jgi:3-oxoacyl-[acyl-carrier protein] reductase